MDIKSASDKEFVIKLKHGSEEAFNILFEKYNRRLYAFSYKMLLSAEDAEEVVQEVFFKVWKCKRLLNEEMSFRSFLFTVAKNYVYNLVSKRVSETAYLHYNEGAAKSLTSETEEAYNFQELDSIIRKGVENMPAKRKEVFTLSRYDGLTNKEIAGQLNLSLSTVENHLNKALRVLKQYLYLHKIDLFVILVFLG